MPLYCCYTAAAANAAAVVLFKRGCAAAREFPRKYVSISSCRLRDIRILINRSFRLRGIHSSYSHDPRKHGTRTHTQTHRGRPSQMGEPDVRRLFHRGCHKWESLRVSATAWNRLYLVYCSAAYRADFNKWGC